MKDIEKQDLNKKIARLLVDGKNPQEVSSYLKCDIESVYSVFRSSEFVSVATDQLSGNVRSASLSALKNIIDISNDKKASQATRLKANQYIVDKALEFKEAGRDDSTLSTMTQDQLDKRFNDFEAELAKRAKKVKIKEVKQSVEDMY